MKKAVLIFDVPECCAECPCEYDRKVCGAAGKYLDWATMTEKRPDWCPLEITDKYTIDKMRRIYDKLEAERENRL